MAIETNGFKDYLGTLPQQSNVDSIMAKDANGNPVWIKKADLAQVAAELLHAFIRRPNIDNSTNVDDLSSNGVYAIYGNTQLPFSYGLLIIFKSGDMTVQIGFKYYRGSIYIRDKWATESWTAWRTFTVQ